MGDDNLLLEDADFLYENDGEGNRTKRTDKVSGDYVTYTWDHRNRLAAVAFFDDADVLQKKVEYDYDLYDRRIARRVDADGDDVFDSAERFVYDGEDIVLVFDNSGSLTSRYLHGPGIDEIFADERFVAGLREDTYWALPDNQGSVRDMAVYDAILEETGIAKHVEFSSFGQITGDTAPALAFLYSYTGREWDPVAELFYYRARWYDPKAMRFLSKDPIGFAAGDANQQRYVGSNATNYVDPSGMTPASATGRAFIKTFRKLAVAFIEKIAKSDGKYASRLAALLNREAAARALASPKFLESMRLALHLRGLSRYFQVHHIFTQEVCGEFTEFLAKIGLHEDMKHNLMFLPTSKGKFWASGRLAKLAKSSEGAEDTASALVQRRFAEIMKRTLHEGDHLNRYAKFIRESLKNIEGRALDSGMTDAAKATAREEVLALQTWLRRELRNGRIALQKSELEAMGGRDGLPGVMALMVGGLPFAVIVTDEDAYFAALSSSNGCVMASQSKLDQLDRVLEQMETVHEAMAKVRQFLELGTADKWAENAHWKLQWEAFAADLFNPVSDAVFASQFAEFNGHYALIMEFLGFRAGVTSFGVNPTESDYLLSWELLIMAFGLTFGESEPLPRSWSGWEVFFGVE